MKSKILLQILLFLLASIILFFTFYNYGTKTIDISSSPDLIQADSKIDKALTGSIDESEKSIPNILKNAIYENFDDQGNKYIIRADTSEFKDLNSKKIFMKGVNAVINPSSNNFLTISSEEAIFNNKSLETEFSKNVELNYLDHNIKGESLVLLFDENLITMKDQIIYKNLDAELTADKITIDMVTKNSKIFMNDKKKKVKILNKN